MKPFLFALTLLIVSNVMAAQTVWSRSFGNPQHPAVIFLHGGPGYNSANFEASTAQALAQAGCFVVVYDRRGEGRSSAEGAQFTFQQTNQDLAELFHTYHLQKATLIGHSFGGVVATLFAKAHPEMVNTVILVGAPVALQATFKTILSSCRKIYTDSGDTTKLKYLSFAEKMDTTSLLYSSTCFMYAMQNNFYKPKKETPEAAALYATLKNDTLIKNHAAKMTMPAPQGFWKNERYTTLDLSSSLSSLVAARVPIYALYGKDDGLYSLQQVKDVEQILGKDHVSYLDQCSHNVFVDQQKTFIEFVIARTSH